MQSFSPSHSLRRFVGLAAGSRLALFASHRRSDRHVAVRLASRLEHSLAEAGIGSLSFYVRGGRVTIAGTIGNATDARILYAIINSVEGVVSVEHRDGSLGW